MNQSEFQQKITEANKPVIMDFWASWCVHCLVNFPALMKSIKQHGYSGWIIVESDRSPNPVESTMMNSWYVQHVLAKV